MAYQFYKLNDLITDDDDDKIFTDSDICDDQNI